MFPLGWIPALVVGTGCGIYAASTLDEDITKGFRAWREENPNGKKKDAPLRRLPRPVYWTLFFVPGIIGGLLAFLSSLGTVSSTICCSVSGLFVVICAIFNAMIMNSNQNKVMSTLAASQIATLTASAAYLENSARGWRWIIYGLIAGSILTIIVWLIGFIRLKAISSEKTESSDEDFDDADPFDEDWED